MQWQTKREGAEDSAGVRMRAAGLSIHCSTFPYLQHMNYRFPHASSPSSQEVDAVLTSQRCLQTKVSWEGDHLIMMIVSLNL